MIKTSSNFRHKTRRRLLIIVAGVFLFWASASAVLTAILNAQLSALKPFFRAEGLTLGHERAIFNLFSGAVINNFYCEDSEGFLWRIKRLAIGFDVSSVLRGKIEIKNLVFGESRIDPRRLFAYADDLGRITDRLNKNVGFFDTTYFGCGRLSLGESGAVAIQGYLSRLPGDLYISKGELTLLSVAFLQKVDPTALNGGIAEPLDYLLDIQLKGGTGEIQRFEINNAVLHCAGSGKINGVGTDEAAIDITLNAPRFILDDLPVINSRDMQTRGTAEFTLHLGGPLKRPDIRATLKIDNAAQEVLDGLSLRKVNGTVVYEKDRISSSRIDFFLNQVPFQADFLVDISKARPHIFLDLNSVPQGKDPSDLVVKLDADWTQDRRLRGEAGGSWRYVSQDLTHHIAFVVKGLEAGVDRDLSFSSDDVRLSFDVTSGKDNNAKDVFHRTFILKDVSATGRKQKEGFALEPLKAACYGGTLEGRFFFYSTTAGAFGANAEGHVRGMDLQTFVEQTPEQTSLILGRLDGDLKFDTELKDMLKGQFFVTNGVIEQNSLMNAVADFLGVPSLKKIAFKDLSVFFSGGRGDYSSKVSLASDDVSALLEGDITSYDTMDGYLSVVISTRLLNESKQFKKILAYIKHDQPSVSFPFKISSYIESPRILWLKNEFKEKLSNLLPERNKRYLQKQVSSMVEGIKVE